MGSSRGRSIRIYLAGGEISGVRHAELVNWTGQALYFPRSRLAELSEWERVASRPGVYFLFTSEEGERPRAYVGESENVLARIRQHVKDTEFHESVLFTSKDENLTKAHVKFLESRLIEMAREAGRYVLKYSPEDEREQNQPQRSKLPRSDEDSMEEFIEHVRLLVGVLGHRILEPVAQRLSESNPAVAEYQCTVGGVSGRGMVTDEGFVVLRGSLGAAEPQTSLSGGYRLLRQELIQMGKVKVDGSRSEFMEDVLFGSPSAAAAVLCGTAVNGRVAWKFHDGRSLKEIEETLPES
jgi:hypothetical protein